MAHDPRILSPAGRALRQTGGTLALTLALGACRADSMTAPSASTDPICYGEVCDGTPAELALAAPIVIHPLEDAVTRIAPNIADAHARAELRRTLGDLQVALRSGDHARARIRLALAYDAVGKATARLHGDGAATTFLDVADLSAIRLALVPAAQALGVNVR